jgi:hypothetical protein
MKGNYMNAFQKSSITLIASVVAIVGIAYAAQPPNVVQSDLYGNTAMGREALLGLTSGSFNTAAGDSALSNNSGGRLNSAFGYFALSSNTTGSGNTAAGSQALVENSTGANNSALGLNALGNNTTGSDNTATGSNALLRNIIGIWNTATGSRALQSNTTGRDNTGAGFAVLDSNSSGGANTATGSRAMFSNTTGNNNSATGYGALFSNTTGINNAAFGHNALKNNAIGFRNVALGFQAGLAVTGSDNIIIGGDNQGQAALNGIIRIGNSVYQKKTYIAGIRGVTTGSTNASAVFVDVNGQLGTIKSSGQFKEDIHPMGDVSDRLLGLRPVTFRYKAADDDGSKPIQYGLIAEEVAQSFPELVVHDAEGNPETVRYDLVATLLLNEFQKEHALVAAQAVELAKLKNDVARMAEVLSKMEYGQMVANSP